MGSTASSRQPCTCAHAVILILAQWPKWTSQAPNMTLCPVPSGNLGVVHLPLKPKHPKGAPSTLEETKQGSFQGSQFQWPNSSYFSRCHPRQMSRRAFPPTFVNTAEMNADLVGTAGLWLFPSRNGHLTPTPASDVHHSHVCIRNMFTHIHPPNSSKLGI